MFELKTLIFHELIYSGRFQIDSLFSRDLVFIRSEISHFLRDSGRSSDMDEDDNIDINYYEVDSE